MVTDRRSSDTTIAWASRLEKSTEASTVPAAEYTVRSPRMNDGRNLASFSVSTSTWKLPAAAS